MSDPIRVEKQDDVVVVTLDAPRGNALSRAMVKASTRVT